MRTATLKHSIPLVFRLRKVFGSRNILPQYFPITYTITAECTFKLPPNIKGCPHLQYENVVQFFFHSLTMVSFLFDWQFLLGRPLEPIERVRATLRHVSDIFHFYYHSPEAVMNVRSIAHGCKMKSQKRLLCHVNNSHSLTLAWLMVSVLQG